MKNWKTTLFGAVAALGAYLGTVADPTWLPMVGKVLAMVGTFGVGFFAQDSAAAQVKQ